MVDFKLLSFQKRNVLGLPPRKICFSGRLPMMSNTCQETWRQQGPAHSLQFRILEP